MAIRRRAGLQKRALNSKLANMSSLGDFEEFIRDKVEKERWTHKQVSVFLERNHPGQRGLSARSVERFCSCKGIHKTPRIDDQKLDEAVSRATDMVSNIVFFYCAGSCCEKAQ